MELGFDTPPDSGIELEALLERSGVDFHREGERFSFLFASDGCKWQTVCDCRKGVVLVYGIYPGPVIDCQRALDLCSVLNAQLVQGSFFIQEEHIVLRTSAQLIEHIDAQERIASALEYNAAAMTHFWGRITSEIHNQDPFC